MFEAKGDYAKALEWYKKKTTLADSLMNDSKNAQLAEAEKKYESEKKEQTIAIQKAEIQKQDLIRNLIIAISAFILAVAGILFWNYRKTQKLNRQLGELNAIKNKLFSAISHDLRSPLMTLDATLAVLRRENVTQEELKQYTGHISNSMNSALGLLDNLLSWSLSQMKGLSLAPSEVKLKELVEENIELYSGAAEKKKIKLSSEISDEQTVYIDKNVGRLVIRNLINNAIKFTHENGTVSVSADRKNRRVEISVKDNGLGMAAEHVKMLFELRTGKTTQGTAKEKGTGLGLVLCKELIEKSNGTISVESEPGEGSTFKISVPASA